MSQPKTNHLFYITQVLIISFSIGIKSPAFCESLLEENALEYRQRGYQAQKAGMLQEAFSYYQKALQINPALTVVYNDLGVLYESLGQIENAVGAYGQAVTIDPNYGKAYFNLALLYEDKGNFRKASDYWLRLTQTKDQKEAIIRKAQARLYELREILPEIREKYLQSEAACLNKEVAEFKDKLARDNKALAQFYIEKAGILVEKKDYPKALHLYLNAKQSDPQNDQIDTLIETTQRKLLL